MPAVPARWARALATVQGGARSRIQQSHEHRYRRLIFIDLETTGPNPAADFITEIGIVEVTDAGVQRWSTLVNPQVPIPPFIRRLTGIDDDMVRTAPTFEMLAHELQNRLENGLFIAHNARFDYGFLRMRSGASASLCVAKYCAR